MGTGGARETAPERGKFAGLYRGQAAAAGPAVLRTAETGFARLPAAGGRPAAVGVRALRPCIGSRGGAAAKGRGVGVQQAGPCRERVRRAAPACRPGRRGRPQAAPESRPEGGLPCGPWGGVCRGGTGKRTMHRTAGSPGFKKTLHNFTKLSPVFTEDKKLCQVLFTICGYNGCQ